MGMAFLWLAGISVLFRNIAYLIGLNSNNQILIDTSQAMSPELANETEALIKEVQSKVKGNWTNEFMQRLNHKVVDILRSLLSVRKKVKYFLWLKR